ncbi:hypothetical protein STEG23_015124 [Scotinomys teguina]
MTKEEEEHPLKRSLYVLDIIPLSGEYLPNISVILRDFRKSHPESHCWCSMFPSRLLCCLGSSMLPFVS